MDRMPRCCGGAVFLLAFIEPQSVFVLTRRAGTRWNVLLVSDIRLHLLTRAYGTAHESPLSTVNCWGVGFGGGGGAYLRTCAKAPSAKIPPQSHSSLCACCRQR